MAVKTMCVFNCCYPLAHVFCCNLYYGAATRSGVNDGLVFSAEAKRSAVKWNSFSVLWPKTRATNDCHVRGARRFQSGRSVELSL